MQRFRGGLVFKAHRPLSRPIPRAAGPGVECQGRVPTLIYISKRVYPWPDPPTPLLLTGGAPRDRGAPVRPLSLLRRPSSAHCPTCNCIASICSYIAIYIYIFIYILYIYTHTYIYKYMCVCVCSWRDLLVAARPVPRAAGPRVECQGKNN